MKPNATKTISRANVNRAVTCRVLTVTSVVMYALLVPGYSANAATPPVTLCVSAVDKTMHDGKPVRFWGYTPACGMGSVGQVPAMPIEVGIGEELKLTLNAMMAVQEGVAQYNGHTIHMHGADVPTAEDGVPDTSTAVGGGNGNPMSFTYNWTPTAEMAGTYMYHCHVHTVKHLEMGMYGPLIVIPKDASGNPLRQLTPDLPGKPTLTTYDFVQTYLFSTVDPAYHAADAVGDAPVFADYNPEYFLLNGKESIAISNGATVEVAAETLTVGQNKKVALRLIGLHSVKGTFSIRDSRDGTGNAKPFTIYVQDGRQYPTPETVTSLEIGPAQRFDIIFTTPATGSGTWYPQFEYKKLRDGAPYATVFGRVNF